MSGAHVAALDAVFEDSARRLVELLGLRSCSFEPFPFDRQLPRIEPGRILLPAAEPGIAPWRFDAGIELPVRHRELTIARFVLVPPSPTVGVGLSPTARAEAMSIADDIGAMAAAALVSGRVIRVSATPVTPPLRSGA